MLFIFFKKVARDEDITEQIGKNIYFDLVDHEKVKSFRIQKQTPFQQFKVHACIFLLISWKMHFITMGDVLCEEVFLNLSWSRRIVVLTREISAFVWNLDCLEYSSCCKIPIWLCTCSFNIVYYYARVGRGSQRVWCPSSITAVLDLGKASKPYLSSQSSPVTSWGITDGSYSSSF